MSGLIVKLIVCPFTVYIADLLLAGISYRGPGQAIIVGLVLAIAAHTMEVLLLRKETFWLSTALDFGAAAVIVYIVSSLLPGARITWGGAFGAAALLTITEVFQHLWLIRTGKTEKSPQ